MKIAFDSKGQLVNILDADNGKQCNCTCLACGEKLVAKNRGKKREYHFAHLGNSICESSMTWLHKAMQIILKEGKQILLPNGELFTYSSAELEVVWNGYRIDVELRSEERNIMVEVIVTSDIDQAKRRAIVASNRECLRFDLSDVSAANTTLEGLKELVMGYNTNKSWVSEYSEQMEIPLSSKSDKPEASMPKRDAKENGNEFDFWAIIISFLILLRINRFLRSKNSKPKSPQSRPAPSHRHRHHSR